MQSRRWTRRSSAAVLLAVALLAGAATAQRAARPGGTITRTIDPRHQTALPFPERSHWLQPWRAYLDTPPTARLRDAVGINLNVAPEQADALCRHLARNGFRHVRIEFGWDAIAWDEPTHLRDPARFQTIVSACKRHGLRPLFLLNAHHGAPGPIRSFSVRLREPARRGDRLVKLDPASAAALVPGRSGLSNLSEYWAAEALVTEIEADGTAHLSKPLPKDLPAGETPAATLKYLPFYPAKRQSDGSVPPEFEETLRGWLGYVETIATAARRALGTESATDAGFDLEVWNELTFGSHFLSINNYYEKPLAEGEWAIFEILRRTVAYVADPVHDLPGVGVCDGFNNQWPWGAGSTAPPGLAALGKHPYAGARRFPQDAVPNNQRPRDAFGNPSGFERERGRWRDVFVPTYVSYFPEYYLTAIQGEHLIRDLSPITTTIGDVEHGRNTHPMWPDNRPAPAPGMWVTEVNLDPAGMVRTARDAEQLKARAILRYLVSFTNKGMGRLYFYAARDPNPLGLGLVRGAFFDHLKVHGNAYPADDLPLTSPTLLAVRRLLRAMSAGRITRPRALRLIEIAEDHGHKQWEGDPRTAGQSPDPHPPLRNRDVLAFFPFQAADGKFVAPAYVMTRDLSRPLPPERYRLTIGGVHGTGARVSLFDPLTGQNIPVRVLGATARQIRVDVPLTDSPRLLTITETKTLPAGLERADPAAQSVRGF